MRPGVVAPGNKRRLGPLDRFHCRHGRFERTNFCGVGFRPNDDEIVVHHQASVFEFSLCDIFLFQAGRVNQSDVGITLGRKRERLTGADGNGFQAIAALFLEQRHQHIEQARVLRTGRGR